MLTGDAANWSFEEKLAALWQVDVVATLRLSRAVGRRMAARGRGVILNIGWDQAETGMAGDSGEMFAAAKGAVMAVTRSLAKSLAPEVRVNCLAPGLDSHRVGRDSASDEWQERAEARVAARALGRARRCRPGRVLSRVAGRRRSSTVRSFRSTAAGTIRRRHRLETRRFELPSFALMPREHIHFVTGRLAEHALRHSRGAARAASWLRLHDRRAADHRRRADDARVDRAAIAACRPAATRVLVPGYCEGDLAPVEAAAGVPVERGPRDLRRLPEFFGREPTPADYGALRHRNHRRDQSLPAAGAGREFAPKRGSLAADGADVIDVGCEPGGPWAGVADAVRALRDDGHRVSIDSLDPREIEPAVRSGRRAGALGQQHEPRRGARLGLRSRRRARRSANAGRA